MNKNYSFDSCLNNMDLNLQIMDELENALGELQSTLSASRFSPDQSSGAPDLEFRAVAA